MVLHSASNSDGRGCNRLKTQPVMHGAGLVRCGSGFYSGRHSGLGPVRRFRGTGASSCAARIRAVADWTLVALAASATAAVLVVVTLTAPPAVSVSRAATAFAASVVSVALAGSRACTVLAVVGLADQEANAEQCERMQGCQWSLSWPRAMLCRRLLRFDGAATS